MYYQSFNNISVLKKLSQADWARLSGVSRAAVTKWHARGVHTNFINMESKTLARLSEQLQLSPEIFLTPITIQEEKLNTLFLWDSLYPGVPHFVAAVTKGELQAVARLVQVLGFHQARLMAGKKVISLFSKYKKYIKPVRRVQLENIWPLYN